MRYIIICVGLKIESHFMPLVGFKPTTCTLVKELFYSSEL
jgi:hypothetical protein